MKMGQYGMKKYRKVEVYKINGDKTKVNVSEEYFIDNILTVEGIKWIYEHGYLYFNNELRV